jgi:hypothetical protein
LDPLRTRFHASSTGLSFRGTVGGNYAFSDLQDQDLLIRATKSHRPLSKQKKTSTPLEVNHSGVDATVWLPLAGGSVSTYASANPSRKSGFLLAFPECASLLFPHCPSAQSDDLIA